MRYIKIEHLEQLKARKNHKSTNVFVYTALHINEQSTLKRSDSLLNDVISTAFDAWSHFWITYGNGKIAVGIDGETQPRMQYSNGDISAGNVTYVMLKSDDLAVWQFYGTCFTPLE